MVMVMETPSPQSVGLQFVRQYYTMLNRAPEHLHRFYNTNSSFVHGGIERPGKPCTNPVYGQQEIHKRIMQLNFRDCHAKISLVDSQATLGDGVVVQVTGELSNNQGPMRKFMQTFVLALQSPKKYYVHNDILRYHDEVYPDEEENDAPEGSVEAEGEDEAPVVNHSPPVNHQDMNISQYYNSRPMANGSSVRHEVPVQPTVVENVQEPVIPNQQPVIPVTQPVVPAQPVVNSSPVNVVQVEANPIAVDPEPESVVENEKPEYTSQDEEEYQEKLSNKSPEPIDDNVNEPAVDEPKTYATMLSKNPGGGSFSSTSPPSGNISVGGPVTSVTQKNYQNANNSSPVRPETKPENNYISQQQQRPQRPNNKGMMGNNFNSQRERVPRVSEESNEGERRRPPTAHYPDNQQLFVGNLPYDVDETALRNVFSEFGNVIDMRINTKVPVTKGGNPGGRNFGFIVFDDPNIVVNILANKQTHYLGDLRLNVEEKKARARMGGNDMRPPMNRGNNMGRIGGPMMGHRGGSRGGGGNMGNMNRGEGRGGGNSGGGNRGGGYINNRR